MDYIINMTRDRKRTYYNKIIIIIIITNICRKNLVSKYNILNMNIEYDSYVFILYACEIKLLHIYYFLWVECYFLSLSFSIKNKCVCVCVCVCTCARARAPCRDGVLILTDKCVTTTRRNM